MIKKPKRIKLPNYLIAGKLCDGEDFCLIGYILNKTGIPKKVLCNISNVDYPYNINFEYRNIIYNPKKIMEEIYNVNENRLVNLMESNDYSDSNNRVTILESFLKDKDIKYYL